MTRAVELHHFDLILFAGAFVVAGWLSSVCFFAL